MTVPEEPTDPAEPAEHSEPAAPSPNARAASNASPPGTPKPDTAPPGDPELPQVVVSPPHRRSFFRFSLLGFLLFTSVVAIMFAVGRLPKRTPRDFERFPSVIVTKRGMYGRRTTYEVRYDWYSRERYESVWNGDVETLVSISVRDYGRPRHYRADATRPEEMFTPGHRQAFDAVRALVRSKIDFDGLSWADERPAPGAPAAPRGPFSATIYPEAPPPHAESFDPKPSASATPSSAS